MNKEERLERCKNCKYKCVYNCTRLMDMDITDIDICVLDVVKKKGWNENSPEMFMLKEEPTLLLKWLSFLRKDRLPKIGDKVVTLRSGFSGLAGVTRTVLEISDKYITLISCNGRKSISKINNWFNDFFILNSEEY